MPTLDKSDLMELCIIDLAVGGRGLAKTSEGQVVFVEGALPGEKVLAKALTAHKSYRNAQCIEIIEPSAQRTAPACPVHETCGGCGLMHLAYGAQVQAKAAWLQNALAGLWPGPLDLIQPSPRELGCRNRVRLQVIDGALGYFARGSHDLVQIDHCPMAVGPINQALAKLGETLAGAAPGLNGWLELIAGDEPPVMAAAGLQADDLQGADLYEAVHPVVKAAGIDKLRWRGERGLEHWPFEPDWGVLMHQGPPVMYAFPGLFSQANYAVNQILIKKVEELAGPGEGREALDLYAGSGNLGLPLAQKGWRVLGLEGQAGAEAAGMALARQSGLTGAYRQMRTEVGRGLRELAKQGQGFDLVVLDPPRSGAKGMMPPVAKLGPQRVIYVSCHGAALARDAKALAAQGYEPAWLGMYDMFPQTGHFESILVMDRT